MYVDDGCGGRDKPAAVCVQVVEVISAAIGDMMRAEFTLLRDSDGNALLPEGGITMSDWEQQTFLASGSLMSRSCKAALMLAEHSDALQPVSYTHLTLPTNREV